MEKEVTNCQECPFCNSDNEYGRDQCNLNTDIFTGKFMVELPSDTVHEKCPLRNEQLTVKLKL